MKVTITFEVAERTAKLVVENSVERVINESCRIIEGVDDDKIDCDSNLADWDVCQDVVVQLWNALRDGVFRDKLCDPQVRDWIV